MGIVRPATPGFLVTLTAAVLLGIVSFSVPYFKSVFFLKASLSNEGISGAITFGTLGYCVELSNGTTCSKPSVGYELDINALVGNNLPFDIPQVVVKWLTYCLVLHIVALALAGISAFFGLLAHVREMSMSCFSTCISGFGATVALLAFIFDLAFFFVAKSRINSVKGGSASIGIGIWLTLAAWLCLFFAGCFFGIGRTCIRRRPRDANRGMPSAEQGYADQMRLEAVKAEADRKARQKQGEIGLPSLPETEPLTKGDDGEIYIDDGNNNIVAYRRADSQSPPRAPGAGGAGVGAGTASYGRQGAIPPRRQQSQQSYAGGYAQAAPGTRAVDDYYNARPQANNGYPPQQPQPRRQGSQATQSSGYGASPYATSPPPMPTIAAANLGAPAAATQYGGNQYGHNQYATTATSAQDYGHTRAATCAYLSLMTMTDADEGSTDDTTASHAQYASTYSNPYAEQPSTFNTDTYNNTGYMQPATAPYSTTTTPFSIPSAPYSAAATPYPAQYNASAAPIQQHERSYTLGGDGYGTNTVPAMHEAQYSSDAYLQPQPSAGSGGSHLPSPYSPLPTPTSSNLTTGPAMPVASSPVDAAGPSVSHMHTLSQDEPMYEDSPPMYDDATAQPPGEWNTKRR
ncbi:hypothetical protein EIP86_004522 [Pleurotus ostreatoroseus]|nr:hypothetical protein EIP86_004522 [Pleurotus ostreatoroseus]